HRHPDGTITTIFSGVDWNKFAPKSARPDIRNAGIIYYITTKRPKIPSPKPVPVPVPVPVPAPVSPTVPATGTATHHRDDHRAHTSDARLGQAGGHRRPVRRRRFDHRRNPCGGRLHRRRRHPRRRPLVRRSWSAVQPGVLALTNALTRADLGRPGAR